MIYAVAWCSLCYPSSSKDGYGDISYAAAHTSTEFESGPVYESIIDATQMEAKACTIQADNDLVTVTCRAYGYIRRK